jgi:antitoxin (DNA-binding transcriptional repressor) of toxin-antitoxin stability system
LRQAQVVRIRRPPTANQVVKKVSITETKNRLSALIEGGSPGFVVDWGRPVARLEPVTNSGKGDEQDGQLARLIREGDVRLGNVPLSRSLFTDQPPRLKGGMSAVAALIEERREGR